MEYIISFLYPVQLFIHENCQKLSIPTNPKQETIISKNFLPSSVFTFLLSFSSSHSPFVAPVGVPYPPVSPVLSVSLIHLQLLTYQKMSNIAVVIPAPPINPSSYRPIRESLGKMTPTLSNKGTGASTSFKTRPRHAKSPYFQPRRQSQRLAKMNRDITQMDPDSEPEPGLEIMDSRNSWNTRENHHTEKVEESGRDYDEEAVNGTENENENSNGNETEVAEELGKELDEPINGDGIENLNDVEPNGHANDNGTKPNIPENYPTEETDSEEDIILASIPPESRDRLLRFIASHPFIRKGRIPVRKSARRSFVDQLWGNAKALGLDEGAFGGLVKYVKGTFLEYYGNNVDPTGEGSEFGEEVDDVDEGQVKHGNKEVDGGWKRKRESTEGPNARRKRETGKRHTDTTDEDLGLSTEANEVATRTQEDTVVYGSDSVGYGRPKTRNYRGVFEIAGTPEPSLRVHLKSGNNQDPRIESVQEDQAEDSYPGNTQGDSQMDDIQAEGIQVENADDQAEDFHSGNAQDTYAEDIQEDYQMEDTHSQADVQTGDTPVEGLQAEGIDVENAQAEVVEIEDTIADVQPDNAQKENSRAESTQPDDSDAENPQADVQIQDTRADGPQPYGPYEEKPPEGAQTEEIPADTQSDNLQGEDDRTEDAHPDDTDAGESQARSAQAEDIPAGNIQPEDAGTADTPADVEAEDTHTEAAMVETAQPEHVHSDLEKQSYSSQRDNKEDHSSQPQKLTSQHAQHFTYAPNPSNVPEHNALNTGQKPNPRKGRNYRKKLYRRRRHAQRKKELAMLNSQSQVTPAQQVNGTVEKPVEEHTDRSIDSLDRDF